MKAIIEIDKHTKLTPIWVSVPFAGSLRAKGRRIGVVKRVVVSLHDRQVTHLIVRRMLGGIVPWREISVPSELVHQTRDGKLQLLGSLDDVKRWAPPRLVLETGKVLPFPRLDRSQGNPTSQVAPPEPGAALRSRAAAALFARRGPVVFQGAVVVEPRTQAVYLTRNQGQVAGVILHPETKQITHFLIRPQGPVARRRLVPVDGVRKISRRYLYLTMEPENLPNLPKRPKVPRPAVPADDVLADEVREALTYRAPTGLAQLDITAKRGVVELRGVVRSEPAREVAERVVRAMRDVTAVRNYLLSDPEIATEVATALAQHPELHDADLRVSSYLGAILLEGTVRTPELRELAERVAREVRTARTVDNQLEAGPNRWPLIEQGGLYGAEDVI